MNRPPRAGEFVSPYELQCIGESGCYETIPPGYIHECQKTRRARTQNLQRQVCFGLGGVVGLAFTAFFGWADALGMVIGMWLLAVFFWAVR